MKTAGHKICVIVLILVFSLVSCKVNPEEKFIEIGNEFLTQNNIVGTVSSSFRDSMNYEDWVTYWVTFDIDDFVNLSPSQMEALITRMYDYIEDNSDVKHVQLSIRVKSQGFIFQLGGGGGAGDLNRDGEIYPPLPTPIPFRFPEGDFVLRWKLYDSEYYPWDSVLTITRKGEKYYQTERFSDGSSSELTELTLISDEGSYIELTDRPGNSFGDYMRIDRDDGWLIFLDNQGYIYSVPPER